jgi:SanA protein
MFFKFRTMLLKFISILLIISVFALIVPHLVTWRLALPRMKNASSISETNRIAIVFGAGLWRDGSPTPVLRDRVTTAAHLYESGTVKKILMSGDNSYIDYNEPEAMRQYAIELGVPDGAIVLDYAGRRTYDTCFRARSIFGIKQAILITQNFHLPRALYTCNKLGVDAIGVSSDLRKYRKVSSFIWFTRELPATLVAFWEIHISHPTPILGVPEPINDLEAQ